MSAKKGEPRCLNISQINLSNLTSDKKKFNYIHSSASLFISSSLVWTCQTKVEGKGIIPVFKGRNL